MKKKIASIFQQLLLLIIVSMIGGFLFFAPFMAIAIMRDNANANITQPDIDVQEQIQSETMIQ